MNVYELTKAKRDGQRLTQEQIEFLVDGFTQGTIPDYQFSAFLMAVYFQGMDSQEITALTMAMMNSGKVFDLSDIPGPKIDKHSTGGVGDKVSLILAPLVAACGVKVPMVSGRGLGHTGGTLDKLEAIPGFRTDLTFARFRKNLKDVGVAMMGQTSELAPADRKMYALRDVTATVDSIPLIAASIMSKKLAEGIDGLVLDVKTGNGAFMTRLADARRLARTMIAIGGSRGGSPARKSGTVPGQRTTAGTVPGFRGENSGTVPRMGKKVSALITRMDQPLGRATGNAVEVVETIEALKGECPDDLKTVTLALGQEMLMMGLGISRREGLNRLSSAWDDGSALERFRMMVRAQGGDERVIADCSRLPQARFRIPVKSRHSGFLSRIDTLRIGMLAVRLGAGRMRTDDKIDPAVGFRFLRKLGDVAGRGDVLAEVLANDRLLGKQVAAELAECYTLGAVKPRRQGMIVERIG